MDAERLLRLLKEHRVDFVIIGATAFPVYGYARATLDMDILTMRAYRQTLSSSNRLLKNSQDTQAAQKGADARRICKRLRRRTGKYADEAARQATQQMRLFQQPAQ